MPEEEKTSYSPRDPENWEHFKSWAQDQNFFPDEIKEVTSFQEAEEKITRLKNHHESDKEYFENLYQLLQAVEQLYVNMRQIDSNLSTLTRKA